MGAKWPLALKIQFGITYLGYAVIYSARKPFSTVKKTLSKSEEEGGISLSEDALANIDTAFLAAYALGMFFLVSGAEKIGIRYVLPATYVLSGVCCYFFGSNSNPSVLGAMWLLNGLLHSVSFPLLMKLIIPWIPPSHRGALMGVWTTSQQIGSFVATTLASYIVEAIDWRWTFYIPGMMVAAMGVLLFIFLKVEPTAEVVEFIEEVNEEVRKKAEQELQDEIRGNEEHAIRGVSEPQHDLVEDFTLQQRPPGSIANMSDIPDQMSEFRPQKSRQIGDLMQALEEPEAQPIEETMRTLGGPNIQAAIEEILRSKSLVNLEAIPEMDLTSSTASDAHSEDAPEFEVGSHHDEAEAPVETLAAEAEQKTVNPVHNLKLNAPPPTEGLPQMTESRLQILMRGSTSTRNNTVGNGENSSVIDVSMSQQQFGSITTRVSRLQIARSSSKTASFFARAISMDGSVVQASNLPPMPGSKQNVNDVDVYMVASQAGLSTQQGAKDEVAELEVAEVTISHVTMWQILKGVPFIFHASMSYFFVKLVRYSLLQWLTYYLGDLDYDNSVAGYLSTLFDVGGIIGSIACGLITDRLLKGQRALTAIIFCVFAAGATIFFAETASLGMGVLIVSMILVGFGIAGPDSVLGSPIAADLCEMSVFGSAALGPVAGIINGMGSAGSVVQSKMVMAMKKSQGWSFVYYFLAGVCLLGALMLVPPMLKYRKEMKAREQAHAIAISGGKIAVKAQVQEANDEEDAKHAVFEVQVATSVKN